MSVELVENRVTEAVVSTSAELVAALKAAQGGDTIKLQPGTYSDLLLKGFSFAGDGVTITSADPENQAIFHNLNLRAVKGLTFQGVELTVQGTGAFSTYIYDSSHLTFDRVFMHGSLDGDADNDTGGLSFLNSSNITVTNSEFTQLRQAVSVGGGNPIANIVIAENHIHHMMKTGIVLAGASNVRITGNVITDIRPKEGNHPDAIQFFTNGTRHDVSDILISGNLITRGDGDATQGIFMGAQNAQLFRNVTITDNMVVGTGYGGIAVGSIEGLVVSGNELISNPGSTNKTTMLIIKSDDVLVRDNEGVHFGYDQVTNVTQTDNATTAAVSDLGTAAVQRWLQAHPEDLAAVLKTATGGLLSALTAPPPQPETPISLFDPWSYAPMGDYMWDGWGILS